VAGADPRGQESGESNPSFPDGEKPTTCSQQRRVSSEPQASTSSDGSWSARGARDLASKSSRADRDPEVFAKKGPGKVRGLSRRSASRQIPCLALRSFPLQPSLQQPRCFPPPAACHFRWPGCRSWLLPPHASSEPPTTKNRAASERRPAGTTVADSKKSHTKDRLPHAQAAATEATPHRGGRGKPQQTKQRQKQPRKDLNTWPPLATATNRTTRQTGRAETAAAKTQRATPRGGHDAAVPKEEDLDTTSRRRREKKRKSRQGGWRRQRRKREPPKGGHDTADPEQDCDAGGRRRSMNRPRENR
jgi:hypothetical protein